MRRAKMAIADHCFSIFSRGLCDFGEKTSKRSFSETFPAIAKYLISLVHIFWELSMAVCCMRVSRGR